MLESRVRPFGRPGPEPVSIHGLIARLFPICSSITGAGPRQVLATLKEYFPLETFEIPTGKKVLDWNVPPEWILRDAYVLDEAGNKVVDFRKSNLHVMSYSDSVDAVMDLEDLKKKIHSLPEHPDWIPYRTSYYNRDWGFCLSHNHLLSLKPGKYRVRIDSELRDGHLSYGEITIPGRTADTVLLSSYICHPSMGNDNLSGVGVLAAAVAHLLERKDLRYTYKCVFVPETIGAITWLAHNRDQFKRIKAGLVLYCIGDRGHTTYKRSRAQDSLVDRAAELVLREDGSVIIPFNPTGSDERQYCSPGINLPVGSLMRTPNSEFDEYHTSADNLDFISAGHLDDSYLKCERIIDVLERNHAYLNLFPEGEPQLGKRGLYRAIGGQKTNKVGQTAIKWVLNYSDGSHSLMDIGRMSGIGFAELAACAETLTRHGLLKCLD